mmetsp:Transcript_548/g.2174  ORF Transcript_548/g.2174 Transcript_548/m.2174 type:complete len:210 (+) Transcript_548:155-784(+)
MGRIVSMWVPLSTAMNALNRPSCAALRASRPLLLNGTVSSLVPCTTTMGGMAATSCRLRRRRIVSGEARCHRFGPPVAGAMGEIASTPRTCWPQGSVKVLEASKAKCSPMSATPESHTNFLTMRGSEGAAAWLAVLSLAMVATAAAETLAPELWPTSRRPGPARLAAARHADTTSAAIILASPCGYERYEGRYAVHPSSSARFCPRDAK